MKNISYIERMLLSNQQLTINEILDLNKFTEKRGLLLSEKQAISLINNRNRYLKELGRIEIGSGTLERIIYTFYTSSYIDKDNYLEILEELTNIFYLYQNEFDNKLTDEQIIEYIKKSSEECGTIELLEGLYLENLRDKLLNGETYE